MPTSDSTVAHSPLLRQLLADRRTDDLGALTLEVAEVRLASAPSSTSSRVVLSDAARFRADLRHANHHLVLRRIAVRLHDDVLAAARERRSSALRAPAAP